MDVDDKDKKSPGENPSGDFCLVLSIIKFSVSDYAIIL